MDGNPNEARLIVASAAEGLPDPPDRVGRELPPARLELLNGAHEAEHSVAHRVVVLESFTAAQDDGADEADVGADEDIGGRGRAFDHAPS